MASLDNDTFKKTNIKGADISARMLFAIPPKTGSPFIKSRLEKCRQISIFAMPVAFTGKYWQLMGHTGEYDLQPWNFYAQHLDS